MEKLKSVGTSLLGIIIFIASIALLGVMIGGAGWVSAHLLPWFWFACIFAFLIILFVLLPLSIPFRTRAFAVISIYCASYLFGATAWMEGLMTTLDLWGGVAVAIGILLGGVGVVPLGLLAAMFHGAWSVFFETLGLVIVTFGCRLFAMWMGTLSDKQSQSLEETKYLQG